MDYITIVEDILEVYNINATEFAKKIDVQRSSISHILSGRNKPSLDMLIKIKEHFPNLRWDYLLLGKKPMTIVEEQVIQNEQENKQVDLFETMGDPSTTPPHATSVENKIISTSETLESKSVIKIVWFYNDNTFDVFKNPS